MSEQYPLREKRKKKSRHAFMDAALDLFANKGYEQTTLESVAEKAGLHVQTLYRHFASKSDLADAIGHDKFIKFEQYFCTRECDALNAWREWVKSSAEAKVEQGSDVYSREVINFWSYPTVHITTLELWHRYEEVLAEGIARDMGTESVKDPLPTLIACMLWGGNRHAIRNWANAGGKANLVDVVLEVVDTVTRQFQHLLDKPC